MRTQARPTLLASLGGPCGAAGKATGCVALTRAPPLLMWPPRCVRARRTDAAGVERARRPGGARHLHVQGHGGPGHALRGLRGAFPPVFRPRRNRRTRQPCRRPASRSLLPQALLRTQESAGACSSPCLSAACAAPWLRAAIGTPTGGARVSRTACVRGVCRRTCRWTRSPSPSPRPPRPLSGASAFTRFARGKPTAQGHVQRVHPKRHAHVLARRLPRPRRLHVLHAAGAAGGRLAARAVGARALRGAVGQWCGDVQVRCSATRGSRRALSHSDPATARARGRLAHGMRVRRGLRVRVGLDYGEVVGEVSPLTGRCSYRGRPVTRGQRVMQTATSNQVRAEQTLLASAPCAVGSWPVDVSTAFSLWRMRRCCAPARRGRPPAATPAAPRCCPSTTWWPSAWAPFASRVRATRWSCCSAPLPPGSPSTGAAPACSWCTATRWCWSSWRSALD